jgi:hypothetical protein
VAAVRSGRALDLPSGQAQNRKHRDHGSAHRISPNEPGWSSSVAGVFAPSGRRRGEAVHSSVGKYKNFSVRGLGGSARSEEILPAVGVSSVIAAKKSSKGRTPAFLNAVAALDLDVDFAIDQPIRTI